MENNENTDRQLRELLASYRPDSGNDDKFMARLEQRLANVDALKAQIATQKHKSRIAVSVAACVGFVLGAISALLYGQITALTASISAMLVESTATAGNAISISAPMVSTGVWCAIALVATWLIYTAYDLTLSLQTKRGA